MTTSTRAVLDSSTPGRGAYRPVWQPPARRPPGGGKDRRERAYRYLRAYIEMAAKELGVPLTEQEIAALDTFEAVANRDDVALRFTLEPGHAIFFNNCTVLHNRTSFEDHPDPARKRHLLRLWLMLDGLRPLVPAVHAYKGTEGIVGQTTAATYYRGTAL